MNDKVSIIIVSWNVREQLRTCLQSIQQHCAADTEVFVVDNASHDGSADMVMTDFPLVSLIRNNTNRGFGAANNQALELATGDYVLFLNDDCQFTGNILPSLIEQFKAPDTKLGMVGVKLLNADHTIQPSVRAWPGILDQTVIQLKLHHLFPGLVNRYLMTNFNYEQSVEVPQVMGAFMFMPLALAKQYGGFDHDYFVWFEEVDLQRRLQLDGYTVWYEAGVNCIHAKGQSFQQVARPAAQRMFNTSLRTYMRKHKGLLAYLWFLFLHPISMGLAYAHHYVQKMVRS